MLQSMTLHVTRRRLPTCRMDCAFQTRLTLEKSRKPPMKTQMMRGVPKRRLGLPRQRRLTDNIPDTIAIIDPSSTADGPSVAQIEC